MSLIRCTTSFGNHDLCSLKHRNDNPGLSTSLFHAENNGIMYMTESCSSESYDPKCFLDSPSDDLALLSTSDVLGTLFNPPHTPSYQHISGENLNNSFILPGHHDDYQFSNESECLDSQSPDVIDCDQSKMKSTLQKLEKALLDDNDDMLDLGHDMEIDGEWMDPIHNILLRDSPKESSSSDSDISSTNSNKEVSVNTFQTPKQLLFHCATAIEDGKIEEASTMINDLRQRVSIQGDPAERIAAYMVEALAARMALSGKGLYKALKCKEPPSSDRLSAMQVLFEVCPCFRFGFMTANGAIVEALKGEKRVHIVDFDINQGSQYYTLLQTLSTLPGKRPHLRLTGVDDPESVQRTVGGLLVIGMRLEKLAEDLQIPFEFHAVSAKTALVSPAMLNCQPGEALVVNFAFQLHHMPDESVSTVNLRDQLLRMVKGLNPKLVTIVEQDVNTNTAPFLPRFAEAYDYYSAVFDSLDATLPRDSQERMNVERQCLARDIINVVACEGEERIERYEVAGKWRARMMMAGFKSCPISQNVSDTIRKLIKQYSERYKMKDEPGALHFGWEEKILIVASAWR